MSLMVIFNKKSNSEHRNTEGVKWRKKAFYRFKKLKREYDFARQYDSKDSLILTKYRYDFNHLYR